MVSEIVPQVFIHEDFGAIRAIKDNNNEPWFVAKDVCSALGLNNVGQAISSLDDDEKDSITINDGNRGNPTKIIISEAGLYSLVLKSRKPEAKAFKRWVTHEVLPSIRRDGGYIASTPDESDDVVMARALLVAQKTIERNKRQIAGLTEDNARMLPKAVAYDSFMETDGTITVTEAARYLSQIDKTMTRKRLFALLRSDGLICKIDRAPTKKAIKQGLAVQIMTTRADGKQNEPYARITQKGLDWCVTHYARIPSQMHT